MDEDVQGSPSSDAAGDAAEAAAVAAASPGNVEAGPQPGWLDAAEPDNASFARTKGWDDVDAVIRSYQNLESMLGSDRAGRTVVLPAEEDDADAYADLYDRLGRPEGPDGYELIREGVPADDDLLDWFRGVAYQTGLSARQADTLFRSWGEMMASRMEAAARQEEAGRMEADEALRARWGAQFDRKQAAADRAARLLGGDDAAALQAQAGNAPLMELLSRVGESLREDSLLVGEGRTSFGLSPEEARDSYDRRKRDPDFIAALQDAGHPGHAAATAERARYLSAIWPNK